MKRTSIKAGVVYAIKPGGGYGTPSPVMFLEDGAAGLYGREWGGSIRQYPESPHYKARRGALFGSDIGYVIVRHAWMSDTAPPAPPWNLDPAAELKRFRAGQQPSVAGLQFDIITSLARIVPWDEAVAENEAREAARQEAAAKSEAMSRRQQAVTERFAALGVKVGHAGIGSRYIELPVWEAEKLLSLLPADPDTEEAR